MDEALVRKDEIKTAGSISFNVKKGTTYYIHIEMSSYFGTPVGCVYHLSTSFAGQKTTSANKNTTTVNKTVKMVTGVSLKAKKKKLNVRFKTVANAAKYQIMYSTKKSFKNKKVVTVRSGNVTIKKLKRKKTYFIRVRAISKNGKAGACMAVFFTILGFFSVPAACTSGKVREVFKNPTLCGQNPVSIITENANANRRDKISKTKRK